MVNPNKLRMMCKLSSFEKKNKKKLDNLSYFKLDYVGFHVFLTLLGVSISLALFILADIADEFLNNTQEFIDFNFFDMGKTYAIIWFAFMIVYSIISSFIYRKKYEESAGLGEEFERMLKKLRKY